MKEIKSEAVLEANIPWVEIIPYIQKELKIGIRISISQVIAKIAIWRNIDTKYHHCRNVKAAMILNLAEKIEVRTIE